MMETLYQLATDQQVVIAALAALAVSASAYVLIQPFFERDRLTARMKSVAIEREQIRARERQRLVDEAKRASLRQESKGFMRQIVDSFNLRKLLADDKTVDKLRVAGFRGQAPLIAFLFARVTLPLVFAAATAMYLFVIHNDPQQSTMIKALYTIGAAYAGFYAPNLYVSNTAAKRQTSIRRAWPDALDLLLICVESGMSTEAGFRKVAEEIGEQSVPLAEELVLATAELSYLEDRRQAYENLSRRTGLEAVKAAMTSLIQADRYGTPVGNALRVQAAETREQRMLMAEQKAAALPPKLTVPMILFFLPVLFVVILGPAAIQIMAAQAAQ